MRTHSNCSWLRRRCAHACIYCIAFPHAPICYFDRRTIQALPRTILSTQRPKTRGTHLIASHPRNNRAFHPILTLTVMAMAALILAACSTKVTTTPSVKKTDGGLECLSSKISYTGNKDYLPGTISLCGNEGSALTSAYKYDVAYSGTSAGTEFGAALIPTSLVGTPTGSDTITVSATLELLRDGILVNKYESRCEMRFYRGIFAGATDFSALRRQGLLSVKENIEQQMMHDILKLQSLN